MQFQQKLQLTGQADKVANISIFSSRVSDNAIILLDLSYTRESLFSLYLIYSPWPSMLSLWKIKLLSYFLPDYTLLAVLDFWGTWMNSKFLLPSKALPNIFAPYIVIHSSLSPHSYFIEMEISSAYCYQGPSSFFFCCHSWCCHYL